MCVDVGSTFTKAVLVDLEDGAVVGLAEHRTTIETDVLDGVDACLEALGAESVPVLACSSAGGGLRIAVVGNEELVTAEAGRRVALSSGGKVVAVVAAAHGTVDLEALAAPDVVLLTGGTDGGNAEVITSAARALVAAGWRGPTVVAGNTDAADEVAAVLGRLPHVVTANVVPRIGVLHPDGARAAIREMFLAHVIGGKHLSARDGGATFVAMVHGATPDVVLTGVEVLAGELGPASGVVVVDVGGATTDVHSVVDLDPEDGALARDVVAPTVGDPHRRGRPRHALVGADHGGGGRGGPTLEAAARARTDDPSYLPTTDADRDDDEAIARAAVGLALRRHAGRSRVVVGPEGRVVERSGTDLREVGARRRVRRRAAARAPGVADRVLDGSLGPDVGGGWQLPEHAAVVVDADYVLAAVGLLATEHPDAAARLARRLLPA